ncbi:HIT family protein [Sphaerisporangium viridialbum]|uniref:HIT family protein n=1 Tax=Sphaerisporangium viridialbum TaxID=46189 RepID=UPI003C77DEC3
MENTPSPCVFCDIVAGRGEASVAYEDDTVVAVMDINPVTAGHTLVIPRVHVVGLDDIDEETGAQVWRAGQRVARALRGSGVRCEGVNLFLADGEAAFQEVFHLHLHVIPRYAEDGFEIKARWKPRDRDLLDQDAAAVRQALR